MELENKVALVTGAGRGIGRAIALRLAREGANLVVSDIELTSATETARIIQSKSGNALAVQADVSNRTQVRRMVEEAVGDFGSINILVNNAGIGGASCLVKDMPFESWDKTLAVNLTGIFNCCQEIIPLMIERGGGKIVNISSLAGRRMSKLGGADYTAAKWGVIGFSKHLAFELADSRINVNIVCPGATLTPLVESKTSPEFRAEIEVQVPLGRWIRPEDQAEAVLFLVSNRAAMLTGHVLDVDGGQLLGLASDYREDLARRTEASARSLNTRNNPKKEEGK